MAGKVITISSGKGGVGKTTATTNLAPTVARILTERHGRIVRIGLIDDDYQHNATAALGLHGISESESLNAVYMAAKTLGGEEVPILSIMRPVKRSDERLGEVDEYVDIAPGHHRMKDVNVELSSVTSRETVLRRAMKGIREKYPYTFIDTHPDFGIATQNALTATDGVIIIVQVSYLGIEGLREELNEVRNIQSNLNRRLKIVGVLPTFVRYDRKVSKSVMDYLRNGDAEADFPFLAGKIMRSVMSFREVYTKIQFQGVSIWQARPDKEMNLERDELERARDEFRHIGEEVLERCLTL